MKKQTMITLALALTLAMPTMPAFAQKAMSKKEIAEKENAFTATIIILALPTKKRQK